MKIEFHKIGFENVFAEDFARFTENNTIDFTAIKENGRQKEKGIIVIYGPNGTGKTSLSKVLSGAENSEIEYSFNGNRYDSISDNFFIISDQNSRNIISGKTNDFVMGYNIKREEELYDLLQQQCNGFQNDVYNFLLKKKKLSKSHPLLNSINDKSLQLFISDHANKHSQGKAFTAEQIVDICSTLSPVPVPAYDAECMEFLIDNYGDDKDSLIKQIEDLAAELEITPLKPNQKVREVEENSEAIAILSRFQKNQCIVCDTCGIDPEKLLVQKKNNYDKVVRVLDARVKQIIQKICQRTFLLDPFDIKEGLLQDVETGDSSNLAKIIVMINKYKSIILAEITNKIIEKFQQYDLLKIYHEYSDLIKAIPEITDDDFNIIKLIVDECMDKQLNIKRDKNKKLIITLSKENEEEQDLIGKSRDKLHLSAGEQNFLSLSFEFLRAKNVGADFIVIDDPISSFDSIYKNKVAYAIVRILQNKKRIVLTHNVDLIYLLECQYNDCFNLYYFNNTIGDEVNGFIPFNENEQEMLISLEKLLSAIRTVVPTKVKNVELYLISMISFMRGYAHITGATDIYNELTQVMHGYTNDVVDIADKYIKLFDNPKDSIKPLHYPVRVADIIAKVAKENDFVEIVDKNVFPQLNRTLNHSLQYLYLRLIVEKVLVDKCDIDTKKYDQLGRIIDKALRGETQLKNRIRLLSKKTLINDFNHFEGNLSIFQPAIDITDRALKAEREDIIKFVEEFQKQ